MASAQLTDRQQQIKALMQEGKDPKQIAAQLKITPNAVYQQLRRMRDGRKSGGSKAGKSPAPAKSTTATSPTTQTHVLGEVKTARPVTPLQSIRNRRDEINAEIRAAQSERDAAQRALAKAEEAASKVSERYATELANLTAAEAALKGEAAPAKAKNNAKAAKAPTTRPRAASGAKNNGTPAPEKDSAPPETSEPAQPGPVAVG